jgi:hypothetical protein
VKTASAITRGFISATKYGKRAARRNRAANGKRRAGIAVIIMATFTRQTFRAR